MALQGKSKPVVRNKVGNKTNKEGKLQKLILDWLWANKYYAWRNYVGPVIRGEKRFSHNPAAGMPDIMGLLKVSGRLFAIEVKVGRNTLSSLQKMKLAELQTHGAVAFVARDLETVIQTLGESHG